MSGASPIIFGGKNLYQPGYYGQRNLSGANTGAASGSRLLLLGQCAGGIPFNDITNYPNAEDRINWVSNSADLDNILRDGPGYYGALFALTPSNQDGVNGAPAVGVIRMNKATRSTAIVKDVDSNDLLDLSTVGYGIAYSGQVARKIEAGTVKGRKVSVKFGTDVVSQDNITNELFSVQYVGAGSGCILILNTPSGHLTTTVSGGPGGENLDIDLTSYTTVRELIAIINANSAYSAVLIGDADFETAKLDNIVIGDSVDIGTAYTVKAVFQAVLDWFNSSSVYAVAAAHSGYAIRIPNVDATYIYLTGGSEGGTPSQQDYQDALDQICSVVDASLIGVMTSDAGVQAAVSAHVTYMSGIDGRNERQACVGSANGDSKATKIAAAQALNNALVGFASTEIKRYDKNGNLLTWDGFYKAAEILGMEAGNPVTFAPTNKMINAIGVKELYSNPDKDAYIQGGCMIAAPSPLGGIRVVRSITTYQGSNIIANEFSAMRTALYITKDHRQYVEALIGEPGDSTILESIKNRATLRLDYYVEQGWLVVDPQFGNAYRNVSFTFNADQVIMTYEGTLVVPVNFVLVTHNFTVIGAKR